MAIFQTGHAAIAEYMNDNLLTYMSIGELVKVSQTLLPLYQDAIVNQGMPPFVLGEDDKEDTYYYLVEKTGIDNLLIYR